MPQETIHIMTTYEMIATAIAISMLTKLLLLREILKSLSSAEWMKFTESLRICSAHRKNSLSMMANKTPALNRSTHSALNIMEHV